MTFALIHLVLAFVAGVGTLPALAWAVFRWDRWRAGRGSRVEETDTIRTDVQADLNNHPDSGNR